MLEGRIDEVADELSERRPHNERYAKQEDHAVSDQQFFFIPVHPPNLAVAAGGA
jgi:hypothetical protein